MSLRRPLYVATTSSLRRYDVLKGRTLLVVCDYYSNFIEVENIRRNGVKKT